MSEIVRYATEEYVDSKSMTDEEFKSVLEKSNYFNFYYMIEFDLLGRVLVSDGINDIMIDKYAMASPNNSYKCIITCPPNCDVYLQEIKMGNVDIKENENICTITYDGNNKMIDIEINSIIEDVYIKVLSRRQPM